jgi:hypothetical protein
MAECVKRQGMATSKVRLPWFTASPKKIMHSLILLRRRQLAQLYGIKGKAKNRKWELFFFYTLYKNRLFKVAHFWLDPLHLCFFGFVIVLQ